jgi:hypothetical protein
MRQGEFWRVAKIRNPQKKTEKNQRLKPGTERHFQQAPRKIHLQLFSDG